MKKVVLAFILGIFGFSGALFADDSVNLRAEFDANIEECFNKSSESACEVAVKYLENECESGKLAKCFFLADMNSRGLGVPKDPQKSYKIYREICDKGSSEGCYEVSVKYLNADGVRHSFEKSGEALVKACDLGSKRACQVLEYVQ